MSISKEEYQRRYQAIRQRMKAGHLDCLLVTGLPDDFNRGNIRYLTGTGRGGTCIFPLEGRPVFLIAPNQTASQIRKTIKDYDLLELKETADFARQASEELSRFDAGNKIGLVGMNCISVPMYLAIKEKFQERLTSATGIFEQLRSVKSPEEIQQIRQSTTIADRVYHMLLENIRPGLTDFEVYGMVKKTIYQAGCEYSFDLIDAEGSRMNMTFYPAGERLKENNTLFMEITPAYEGYYGQLPVTLPVGKYPDSIKKMIRVWKEADREAFKLLRPGTRVSAIYHTMMKVVQQSGYVSPLRPGHSIGLDALDFWSITENNDITLEPGMVLAVHPSIMTGLGGDACGMGYTYLITEAGAERFSRVELDALI